MSDLLQFTGRAEGEIARSCAVLVRTVAEVGRTQRLRPSGAVNELELDLAIAGKGEDRGRADGRPGAARVRDTTGPAIVNRYKHVPVRRCVRRDRTGVSSGTAIGIMEAITQRELPAGMGF